MTFREKVKTHILRTGNPILLWGSPGVGKTHMLYSIAKELDLPMVVIISSVHEPSDLTGYPHIKVGNYESLAFAAPAWAHFLREQGKGILFLDELSCAPPAVQAAVLRVALEKVVGELKLPNSIRVIAAANPPEEAAGGWELTPPLANRFVHIKFENDPVTWAEDFVTYWGAPPEVPGLSEEEWAPARALVSSFIHHRPALALQVPKDAARQGGAWPSFRSWDAASRILAVFGKNETQEMAQAVGPESILEFTEWLTGLELPNPEELLENPESLKLPARGDRAFAVLQSVVAAVASKNTAKRWENGWKVLIVAVDQMKDISAAVARGFAKVTRPADAKIPKGLEKLAKVFEKAGIKLI